jgi:hypothetical protein
MRGYAVKHLIKTCRNEDGSAVVVAFMLLVVLTLLGVFSTRTARIDIQVASNEIPYQQNFYIAEGGVHREAAEVARGNYPIANVTQPEDGQEGRPWLASYADTSLPSPTPHQVDGLSYKFWVGYLGAFSPPAGYSILHFSRYDYDIQATRGDVTVRARYFKIGPKAE